MNFEIFMTFSLGIWGIFPSWIFQKTMYFSSQFFFSNLYIYFNHVISDKGTKILQKIIINIKMTSMYIK